MERDKIRSSSERLGMDQPEAVSLDEDSALEDIARELGIDHGESWAKLLEKLR